MTSFAVCMCVLGVWPRGSSCPFSGESWTVSGLDFWRKVLNCSFFHSFLMEIPECPGVKCPIGTTCVEEPKECLTAPCAQYSCQIKQGMLLLFSPTHPRTRYHLPLVTSWFFSGLKVSSINYRELILFLLVNPRC